jgi:hypothetical protein
MDVDSGNICICIMWTIQGNERFEYYLNLYVRLNNAIITICQFK